MSMTRENILSEEREIIIKHALDKMFLLILSMKNYPESRKIEYTKVKLLQARFEELFYAE